MNTLKKTAAVVLAIAMVLTMGIATSFAAYPDVASTESYAEAVNILSNLGIFEGGDDGLFRPNNTITRAEVAAVMVRAKNLTEMPGETVFTDVPANHWAAGYINTAYTADIISGRGNGIFDPNGNVTFEEAVKMIVAALGYEPAAKAKGGWPTGYLAVASEKDISNRTGGEVNQPATRATIARLVYNALEVDMMNQTTYGTSAEYQPVSGKTLLTNLGVEKLDVVVSGSYYTDAAMDQEYDRRNHTVYLTSLKNNVTYNGEEYDKDNPFKDMAFDEGGTAAASLLGMACVAYVGVDDDTDDDTIFAISAKNARNTVTSVKSDLLAKYDELSSSEQNKADDGTVYYWRNGRTDRKPVALTPSTDANDNVNVRVFVNYEEQSDYDGTDADYFTSLIADDGGLAEFIDNNNDGDFDVVLVSQYTAEGVVESVRTTSDGLIDFRGMDGAKGVPEDYDPEDDSILKLFIKGENYIDPTEIAAGDTITTIGADGDAIIIYLVSSDKIEGRSSSYDSETETLTVAGKAYAASPLYKENLSTLRNTTGTFYLNADGLISLVDGSTSATGDWGYVLGVDKSTRFSRTTYEVEILDGATGRVNTYVIKSENVAVYNSASETKAERLNDEDVYEILSGLADPDSYEGHVIKYTVDNNEISKVVVASNYADIDTFNTMENGGKAYDSEDRTIGSSDPIADNAYVFIVSDGTEDPDYNDPDNISVVKGGRFVDRSEYKVYAFSENDLIVAAVVLSTETEVDKAQGVFVVTSISTDINDDDEDIVIFQGIQDGGTRTFQLYDDDENYVDEIVNGDLQGLAKGTVLLVGPEENGYVDNIDILVEVVRSGNTIEYINNYPTTSATASVSEDYKSDMGQLVDLSIREGEDDPYYVDGSTIVIDGFCSGYDNGDNNGYRVDSRTNVVAVDFTAARYAATTVRRSDVNFADVDPEKYEVWAFFRAYDVDEIDDFDLANERRNVKDLVLYKLNADNSIDVDGAAAATQSYTHSSSKKVDDLDKGSYLDDDDDNYLDLDEFDNSGSLDEVGSGDGMIAL